ncbi:MAG: TAT-variant-translocated molybdopterin oxidoreductase [Phycisphaerales bacterium JB052]
MSNLDQCPSSKGKEEIPTKAPELGTVSGRKFWRSLDEYSGTPEFKEFVEREFPAGASILGEPSRRNFVKIMGAGFALAGAATIPGCRRPDRKILPYSQTPPEEVIPGKPLYFTTALPLPGGGCEGLLIETHTGRPTKVEGNPLHPGNQGKTSAMAQASVLSLYDPDRLMYPVYNNPTRGKLDATWDDFNAWQTTHFAKFDANNGAGLAFIIDKQSSPTRQRLINAVRSRFPRARFVFWNPAESRAPIDGSVIAFGAPQSVSYDFSGTQRVVSVGGDFIASGAGSVKNARTFASTRKVMQGGDEMSRLYAVESKPTSAGSLADHRFRLAPSQLHNFTIALTKAVFSLVGANASGLPDVQVDGISQHDINEIAKDLADHRNHSVVVPGDQLSAEGWALCMAMNQAMGNMGRHVFTTEMGEDLASDSGAGMRDLVGAMSTGSIDTLVTINCNPVYDAPASLGFADAFVKVANTITLDLNTSETEHVSTWSLNGTHYLEQWGDVTDIDGMYSVVQPMIAPLYDPAHSDIELLSMLAGETGKHGHELVQETWSSMGNSSESSWRRLLHNGFADTARKGAANLRMSNVLMAAARAGVRTSPGEESMDVLFYTSNYNSGQLANNGWLQELPEFGPSVVWDNPVLVSPITAKKLGLLPEHAWQDEYNPYTKQQMPQAQLVTMTLDGHEMEVALWILPGMADNTVAVKLGYGRQIVGRVGFKVGHNTYEIKPASGTLATRGATLKKAAGTYTIASTQNHWSLGVESEASMKDSRHSLVRAMDKKWWDKHADLHKIAKDEIYGKEHEVLNLAEKIGELSHTPPNISIYDNPQNRSKRDPDPSNMEMNDALNRETPPRFAQGPQWGMSIDLNACMGCNACTVACQSENNIPIVGKNEVAKGREMQWIRMDRYFVGEDLNNPDEMIVQPVACVHCENAPCETVCPVNATVHGDEGTNDMAYNRCIGTRYCANNCPYKVRRFNFFDYAPVKFNGGLDSTYTSKEIAKQFEETVGQDRTFNQNFIPPRLRKKLDEISKMHMNPDVTVRSRGVMEKCTYCIQRVHQARQEVKIKGIWEDKDQTGPIPDGFFNSACQQVCPTDAISFGDILDPESRVSKEKDSGRSYLLLGYLNTRPRTTYMMRVRNPNEAIRVYDDHDPLDHGGHGDAHGDDGHGEAHTEQHGAAYIDRTKKIIDQGYSMSLKVLSGINA